MPLVLLFLLAIQVAGCFHPRLKINEERISSGITDLIQTHPEQFTNPLTLVVLVDHTPCTKALTETIWWDDWQTAALSADCGFVFATSRADSADLGVTARLDSVKAPILVMPSCPDSLRGLGIPNGCLPFKVIIDRAGSWHYWSLPIIDSTASARFTHTIDSLGRILAESRGHL